MTRAASTPLEKRTIQALAVPPAVHPPPFSQKVPPFPCRSNINISCVNILWRMSSRRILLFLRLFRNRASSRVESYQPTGPAEGRKSPLKSVPGLRSSPFFFKDATTPEIYTLFLHAALDLIIVP